MLRLMLRPLLLLITVLALCLGAVRVGYGLAYPLEAAGVFAMSECELPCWMGLEAGVTGYDESLVILETFEITRTGTNPQFLEFTVSQQLRGTAFFFDDDLLTDLGFIFTGCPASIVIELGIPERIIPQDGLSIGYFDVGMHVYEEYAGGFVEIAIRNQSSRITFEESVSNTQTRAVSIYDPYVQDILFSCHEND